MVLCLHAWPTGQYTLKSLFGASVTPFREGAFLALVGHPSSDTMISNGLLVETNEQCIFSKVFYN